MATKTPDTAEAAPSAPAKSKKLLVLALAGLVVLALLGGGWFFLSKKNAALDEDEEDGAAATAVAESSGPPTYLALDNMVVNLADPGGERVAQIGITLELVGALAVEKVRAYLPSIRSDILLLVSQRSAEDLLSREGKEQLAADIQAAAGRHFLKPASADKGEKKAKGAKGAKGGADGNPVRGVLFSSFIVQ